MNSNYFFVLNIIAALCCTQLFAQSNENVIRAARFDLAANSFLNSDEGNYLGLTVDQWMTQRLLLKEYGDWFENNLENVKKPNYEELTDKLNRDLYERFAAVLDDEQVALLDQFMIAKSFSIKIAQMAPQVSAKDIGSINKSIAWLHPEISSHIRLSKTQHDDVNSVLEKFGEVTEIARSNRQAKVEKLLDSWNLELVAQLTHKEKSSFENSTGKAVEFPKWIQSKFKIAYRFGPLPLMNTNINSRGRINGLDFKQFSLVRLPSMFNNEFEWNSLFSVLKSDSIAKELKLTIKQIEKISDLESKWEELNPLQKTITVANQFGLKPEHGYAKQKELQKPFEIELSRILNAKQNDRFRQLWNQIVIGFGWKEVPLAHPDWKRALKLSEKTVEKIDKVNKAKREEFAELNKELEEESKDNTIKFKEQVAHVLTEKQNKMLDKLFGRFRELVD